MTERGAIYSVLDVTPDDSRLTSLAAARIVRRSDARTFFEGPEECQEYHRDRRLWFGVSTVPPGEQGDVDRGHPESVEVFYCTRGTVLVRDGVQDYELSEGDALVIPPSLPHAIVNIGEEPAVVVWAGAPGE